MSRAPSKSPPLPPPKVIVPKISDVPTPQGRFGVYGGCYVPETLTDPLHQLATAYEAALNDASFWDALHALLKTFAGRPTPLFRAARLTDFIRARTPREQGAAIWLKREDLNHSGSHHINNCLGQALLAVRMGKTRLTAESASGQHGVATATAAALFGLSCEVFIGAQDAKRHPQNVSRMKILGAKVSSVSEGDATLKDAVNAALRDWMGSTETTHYLPGSAVGPHPYPMIVRDLQCIIGREMKAQSLRLLTKLPDAVVACVGGGGNAAGAFYPFIDDPAVRLVGVEAGGRSNGSGQHSASLAMGTPGLLHGAFTYVLQDANGQTSPVSSCATGLTYSGVGPEHAYWKDLGRVTYALATDTEAQEAFTLLARTEGVIPSLETAHALAHALKLASELKPDQNIVVNLSGRGDQDAEMVLELLSTSPGSVPKP